MPYRTLNEALETVIPSYPVSNNIVPTTSNNNFNFSNSLCTCNTTNNITNNIVYPNQSTSNSSSKISADNRRLSSINDEQLNNIQSIIS